MILLNPKKYDIEHSDKCFQQIILKTIDFFENKGLKKVKDSVEEVKMLHHVSKPQTGNPE